MTTKAGRSPEEWIQYLITAVEYAPTKPDWNAVAVDTGTYKSGKFAVQAYNNLRKKYGMLPGAKGVAGTGAAPPATPNAPRTPKTPKTPKSGKTPKKRGATVDEDDPVNIPKKARKVEKEELKEDEEEGEFTVKIEDDDEIEEELVNRYEASSEDE